MATRENLRRPRALFCVVRRENFRFPQGIPAFEQHRDFRREADPHLAPLIILRSLGPESVRLVCLPLEWIDPDYRLNLGPSDVETLGPGVDLLELLAVLTIPDDGVPTANLLAPLVLNHETGCGVQSIQFDSSYPSAQPLAHGRSAPCS